VGLFFSVGNHSDVTQTIRIEYALDGPGTELDLAFTKEVVVEAGDLYQERDGLRARNRKTPLGECAVRPAWALPRTGRERAAYGSRCRTTS
jgi:hypothetical protein